MVAPLINLVSSRPRFLKQGEQTQTWSLADGKLKVDRTGGRGPSSTTYTKGS